MTKPHTITQLRRALEGVVKEAEKQGWSESLPEMREAYRVLDETKPTLAPCYFCGDPMCSGIFSLCPAQ